MRRTRITLLGTVVMALAFGACRKPGDNPQAAAQSSGLSPRDELILAAANVGLPPQGIAPGDLPDPQSPGAKLLATYCAQCHDLPTPATHSATDWPSVARRMWLRMEWLNPALGVKVPSMGERYALLAYLTSNALKVSGSNLPAGRGRETFALICSRCHELPDPRVHSREDWPTVYARMERNMERMKVASPTGEQSTEILLYLQTVSGR